MRSLLLLLLLLLVFQCLRGRSLTEVHSITSKPGLPPTKPPTHDLLRFVRTRSTCVGENLPRILPIETREN
uniref:Putative secreted protein n=1 Tax=Anopheles marajoara TaxID=58244 RepID=A0A2M4CED4_9DIPT